MDLERARYLISPAGRAALAAIDPTLVTRTPTALATALRRSHGPFEASALAEQLTLRHAAIGRLDTPSEWLLAAAGLEMMTHPSIAARRAERLAATAETVADLTCGLGGDLHAVAGRVPVAIGIEREPATAVLAAANTPAAHVLRGDATQPPLDLANMAVLIDPSRRTARDERTFDPAQFSPPLSTAIDLARAATAAVIKGPPGLPHHAVPPDAELEAVQYGRTLRELALWFGASATPGLRRAVYLPTGANLDSTAPECDPSPAAGGDWLIDPQSCVTRAGLVRHLAALMSARLLGPEIAYLVSDAPASSPLGETFQVLERMPFSVDRLKKRLRECRWSPRDIRRRAFPIEPDELRRLLGRIEGSPVTLICTTIANDRTIFICRPAPAHAGTSLAD